MAIAPDPSELPLPSNTPAALAAAIESASPAREAWRRLRKNRLAVAALVYLIAVCLTALLTPLWPLESPYHIDTTRRLQPPSALGMVAPAAAAAKARQEGAAADTARLDAYSRMLVWLRQCIWQDRSLTPICGTDELGRDLLARLCWGARVSLLVGVVATLVSLLIGVTYGAVAGYLGGWIDDLMMRAVDVLYSIPLMFVMIFLITFLSEERVKDYLETELGIQRMTVLFLLVGTFEWMTMARVVRGQVLALKHEPFVESARALGAGQSRILLRHVVPNLWGVIIVYLTLTIPQVMLLEAFLSFLGLGVQAPDVSWGLLANQGFRVITPVRTYWWLVLFPGLALGSTLLALNILGDGLRDALDPRMKNRL